MRKKGWPNAQKNSNMPAICHTPPLDHPEQRRSRHAPIGADLIGDCGERSVARTFGGHFGGAEESDRRRPELGGPMITVAGWSVGAKQTREETGEKVPMGIELQLVPVIVSS
jgi:hypothetical protein